MYDRRIKEKTLTFAVSGMLWEHSLVLIDNETESLWSQLLGEAMRGKLAGEQLTVIPSLITDWKSWRTQHPETTAMLISRTANAYRRQSIPSDEPLLIGLTIKGKSRAWFLKDLQAPVALNDQLADLPLLVVQDAQGTVAIYGRSLDEHVLKFQFQENKLTDLKTHSTWDPLTGKAISGSMKGRQLKLLPGILSFAHAWKTFHPQSEYWNR